MFFESLIQAIYHLIVGAFALLILFHVVTTREVTVRAWGAIILIPLILRVLGIK